MSDLPVIGPSLPPHLTARDEKESDESIVAQSLVGPQLPPTRESTAPPSKASYGRGGSRGGALGAEAPPFIFRLYLINMLSNVMKFCLSIII